MLDGLHRVDAWSNRHPFAVKLLFPLASAMAKVVIKTTEEP